MRGMGRTALWAAEDLDSGGTLTSPVIDTKRMYSIALLLKAANAGGTAGVSIKYATSPDGTNFGAYDNVIEDDSVALTTPEDWHEYVIAPAGRWIKVQLTELKSLNNNVIDAKLQFSEEN